jgi:hypothetical protein
LRKRAYWTGTGSSSPRSFSIRCTCSGVAWFPAISRAGFAGTRKKITKETNVTATSSTAAQSTRLIRYVNT